MATDEFIESAIVEVKDIALSHSKHKLYRGHFITVKDKLFCRVSQFPRHQVYQIPRTCRPQPRLHYADYVAGV